MNKKGALLTNLNRVLLLFFILFIFSGEILSAAVYKYVDHNGAVHYSNVPVLSNYRYYQAETGDKPHRSISVMQLIKHYAQKNDLDENLVRAVVKAESNFNSHAVSAKGAIGLMQLHPGTIKDLKINDPFDPSSNIAGGTKYLRWMLSRFNGNLEFALAAYNAGPSTVERYNGIPPYPETQLYVKKVKLYQQQYRQGGS
ncbi:MAG: lytic transglycosylase [Desulfobacteraceae bacterium 4572_35.2]|nr:MAG: lytic transglycosylase [Desulfobacteraceae bacterium 4572_35.2]